MSVVERVEALSEPICLPDIEILSRAEEKHGGSSSIYGATAIAAAYCGFEKAPSLIPGQWMHGWFPSHREKVHPASLWGLRHKMIAEDYYWVSRKDEEDYLRQCGYRNAVAIGLPLVYLPTTDVPRRPGSLLVMPAHSIEYTEHNWKFDEYAESIASIRSKFREVVVCIHPNCWKKGYWIDAFRNRGFPVVSGASPSDRNALKRIQCLMSSFEFVTTNSFGSQLAYAAYFGAKPSVYGMYVSFQEEDFRHDPCYTIHPELLAPDLEATSEKVLRQNCPQFFCHPREAKSDVEWGRFELGESNKVSPRRLRSLFGWNLSARARRAVRARMPGGVKHSAKMALNRSYRETKLETQRLLSLPRHQPTSTTLLGPRLQVLDGHSFILKKQDLFDSQTYEFVAAGDAPRIVDCGAGIGLGVCYFKKIYPQSQITAFEPDPNTFETLKRNCESWGAKDVRLIPKAVWNSDTTVSFAREDFFPGRISERPVGDQILQVQACRLREYLTSTIDLLKLNIEGAEVDVLLDCTDLLGQVQNLVVDYHSIFERPQRLDTLMELLTKTGFRMQFRSFPYSTRPLVQRIQSGGIDSKLQIFATRF
jgi:FkbM family methyltransferase